MWDWSITDEATTGVAPSRERPSGSPAAFPSVAPLLNTQRGAVAASIQVFVSFSNDAFFCIEDRDRIIRQCLLVALSGHWPAAQRIVP